MDRSQRILIVNRHYWPEINTYAQLLRQIAGRWVTDGHEVDVLTALPSYRPGARIAAPTRQSDNGVRIFRAALFPMRKMSLFVRLANSIPFFLAIFWHFLKSFCGQNRYDIVLVATNPPIIEVLLIRALTAIFGGKYIYHLQDIHPEVEISASVMKQDGLLAKVLSAVDSACCKSAAACVTLSHDMTRTILRRYKKGETVPKVQIINNFIFDLEPSEIAIPETMMRSPEKFRVIFAGNVGFFQGLEQVVEAAKLLQHHAKIEFVFLGDGIAVKGLSRLCGTLLGNTVKFFPVQPMQVAHALIDDADLALICLKKGVIAHAYPSKTMSYAAAGTPILAIVEPDSDLAATISAHQLGYVVPQDETDALAKTISSAFKIREKLRAGRPERKRCGNALFGPQAALDAWSTLITDLAE